MNRTLPQLCIRCHKLKMPDLGSFKRRAGRCHDYYWVCHECVPEGAEAKSAVLTRASWLERKVVPVLQESGFLPFHREFELGVFRFDFCLPKLWLLIEADSYTWHRRKWQQKRDAAKDALAETRGFKVARVRDPDIEGWTRMAIERRAEELGLG